MDSEWSGRKGCPAMGESGEALCGVSGVDEVPEASK